jgi:hypothetical protein
MYTENIKKNIYKWRETHREEYNEYMLKLNMKHYYDNQEERKKKRMEQYYNNKEIKEYGDYEKISKTFRRILL